MTEQSETGSRLVDLARQEANAALSVLLDPATAPSSAEVHVLEAWRLICQGAGGDATDTPTLTAWIRSGGSALSESERADAAKVVEELAARQTVTPLERGRGPTPRALVRHVKQLQRTIDAYEPELRPPALMRRIWLRRALAALSAFLVLAAFLVVIRDKTDLGTGPWRGDYYPTHTFEGKPILRRDADIDFNWKSKPPLERISADLFSMRWDTCLFLPEATEIHFWITSDDGSKLYVDGEPLIDLWEARGKASLDKAIELEAGVHHLRLDYFERRGSARITLEASIDGEQPGPIPKGLLYYPGDTLDPVDVCHAVRETPDE